MEPQKNDFENEQSRIRKPNKKSIVRGGWNQEFIAIFDLHENLRPFRLFQLLGLFLIRVKISASCSLRICSSATKSYPKQREQCYSFNGDADINHQKTCKIPRTGFLLLNYIFIVRFLTTPHQNCCARGFSATPRRRKWSQRPSFYRLLDGAKSEWRRLVQWARYAEMK